MHFINLKAVYYRRFGHSEDTSTQIHQSNLSPEEIMTLQIWRYATPVLLLTGTFGSLASVCILLRPNIRKSTPMYFLTLLAFTDAVALWLGLLRLYISYVHGFDVRDSSNLSCKLHTFSVYFILDLGSWLLALIAIERFLFIVCPHTAKLQWNRMKGTYAVIVVVIILILVNGHYIFTTYLQLPSLVSNNVTISSGDELISNITDSFNITEEKKYHKFSEKNITALSFWFNTSETVSDQFGPLNNNDVTITTEDKVPRCKNQPWSEHFHNKIFPWIDFAAFFFLPFCIMVVTHVWIIRHVHLAKARLRKTPQTAEKNERKEAGNPVPGAVQCTEMQTKTTDATTDQDEAVSSFDASKECKRKGGKSKTHQSKVAGVSVMLISVLVSFVITTCPITIYVIISLIQLEPRDQTPEDLIHQNFQWVIVNMIQYTNNASHFFLFILTSKNFRHELLKMIEEFWLKCKRFSAVCKKRSNTVEPIPT